jgi:small-conductance mechanosensitive channel
MITENDTLSMLHGTQATKLATSTRALSTAEQANVKANQKNRELSQVMLALAEEMKAQSAKDIEDPKLRDQVTAVEKELKQSRSRAKTIKGILSAMVVGSGINWAADEALIDLVLDDEDDD